MKIMRNDADRLILERRPFLTGVLLILGFLGAIWLGTALVAKQEILGGIWLLSIGVGMFALCFLAFVRKTQLWLDRPGNSFAIRERTMFGQTEKTGHLSDISHAIIEEYLTTKSGMMFRPVLLLADRKAEIPILVVFSKGKLAERTVGIVNDWLARSSAAGRRVPSVRQRPARESA